VTVFTFHKVDVVHAVEHVAAAGLPRFQIAADVLAERVIPKLGK
jgi:hypothetical protein